MNGWVEIAYTESVKRLREKGIDFLDEISDHRFEEEVSFLWTPVQSIITWKTDADPHDRHLSPCMPLRFTAYDNSGDLIFNRQIIHVPYPSLPELRLSVRRARAAWQDNTEILLLGLPDEVEAMPDNACFSELPKAA
ncbi:MAG: hypothetical protein F6K42_05440 [Leptolyngbya sp. SIO1D8]|nr:hypothetical protein [Leptolyngbya sp. SIO1D8]